jgi:hypothetical protein
VIDEEIIGHLINDIVIPEIIIPGQINYYSSEGIAIPEFDTSFILNFLTRDQIFNNL